MYPLIIVLAAAVTADIQLIMLYRFKRERFEKTKDAKLLLSAKRYFIGAMCSITVTLLLVVFAAVNIVFGLDFITGVTASVACIGNVGPGFGDVGSMANYADFPAILKTIGMIEMLIGRLEIYPALYLMQSVSLRVRR